jgi:hypothetical protein
VAPGSVLYPALLVRFEEWHQAPAGNQECPDNPFSGCFLVLVEMSCVPFSGRPVFWRNELRPVFWSSCVPFSGRFLVTLYTDKLFETSF